MKALLVLIIFYSSFNAKSLEKYYIILPGENMTDSATIEMYHHLLNLNKIDSCHSEYVLFSCTTNYHEEKDKSYFGVIENNRIEKRPIYINKIALQNQKVRQLKYVYPLETTFSKKELINNEIELFIIFEEEWENDDKQLISAYECSLVYLRILE